MHRSAPSDLRTQLPHSARSADHGRDAQVYGASFWFTYLANSCVMVAVSLLFRYADFVVLLGGSELQLGLITGIGMTGSLAMRVFQGIGIDRHGPRLVWLLSLALMVMTLLAHLWVGRLDGPAVYLLRILYATSIAGAFGASITYVSLRAPAQRMAETIGMLGTSGFVGLALGPVLGDVLMDVPELSREHVNRMFLVAAAMAGVSFVCAAMATRSHVHAIRRRPPPLTYLIRRYHPGTILLVGMAMGVGLGLPHTFLRTYAMEIGVGQIKWFFLVYAAVAFGVRLATRGLADRWGVRPAIYLGLNSLAVTMLLFLAASTEWLLVVPAVMGGVAHALLFPAVVSGANLSFPRRYRGLATTLIMAMFDLGNLVGQPSVGAILEVSNYVGLPRYGTMFVTVAAVLSAVSAIYALSGRRNTPAIDGGEVTSNAVFENVIPTEAEQAAACTSGQLRDQQLQNS